MKAPEKSGLVVGPKKQDNTFLSIHSFPFIMTFLEDVFVPLKEFVDFLEPYCSPFESQATEQIEKAIDEIPNGVGDHWYGLKRQVEDEPPDGAWQRSDHFNTKEILTDELQSLKKVIRECEVIANHKFDPQLYAKIDEFINTISSY